MNTLRLRAQGRPAAAARLAGCRTTARRWSASPSWSTRCRGARDGRSPGASRPGSRSATPTTRTSTALVGQAARASRRSGVDALRAVPRRHPARAPAPAGPRRRSPTSPRPTSRSSAACPRGLPAGMPPRRLPDRLLGHGHRALPRRRCGRHRPPHRPVLDRPRHLLADARPRRCRDVHAHGEPAADRTGTTTRSTTSAMGYELHIGPYRGRDPQLWRASTGHRRQRHGAVRGVAHPVRDDRRLPARPRGLRPGGELAAGHARCRGRGGPARRFALFADNVRSSCLSADDAPIVGAGARVGCCSALDQGDARRRGGRPARRSPTGCSRRPTHLLRGPVREPRAHRRVPAVARGVRARRAGASRGIADLAAEGRLDSDGPSELRPFLIRLRRARVRVFGDVLEMTLSVLSGTMFRPGEVP